MTGSRPGSIAVVGAGLAGLRACEGLRQRGFEGRLSLLGEEPHLPYDRPPLSKQFLAGDWGLDRVLLRSPEQLAALELDLRLGPEHRVAALDLEGHRLHLAGGEAVAFDGLVIATGSAARRLPGINDLPGVHVLRTLDDALALGEVLSRPGVRLGLAGAGFIGLEVAATARRLGAEVTVVEPLEVPLGRALPRVCGEACARMHLEEGVRFHLGTLVEEVETGGAGELRCRLSDGSLLEVDALLVGVGAAPSVAWLEGSGLRAGPDGIVCDENLVAHPGVVVAGDVARWPRRLPGGSSGGPAGETVRVEHRTNAAEQGDWAAAGLLADLGLPGAGPAPGEEPSYAVPYVWSDQYRVKIQVLGLPRPDDEVLVVEDDPSERRFLALCGRGGCLEGVVGFSRPRHVMSLRSLLERPATLEEALASMR